MPTTLKLPDCARCGHPWDVHHRNLCTHRSEDHAWLNGRDVLADQRCNCVGGPYSQAQGEDWLAKVFEQNERDIDAFPGKIRRLVSLRLKQERQADLTAAQEEARWGEMKA